MTAGKSKGKKKSKQKAADMKSVFAALDQNGHAGNGDAEPGDAQPDAMTNGAQLDVGADEAAAFGKKKKKSSKQKGNCVTASACVSLGSLLVVCSLMLYHVLEMCCKRSLLSCYIWFHANALS